ncbi:MAG TPA: adenylate/guanylate cyclase domain-containing protein [Candidatus Ozemobacteraceae bacterium]|nr:adenylate/guanylate cyclase domain-containing protein [Candidatus Ozemobacteraceae bacterium]
MKEDRSKRLGSGWMAALLPFLILAFPLYLLHRESAGIDRLASEAEHRAWLTDAETLAERFRERSTPEFWLEESMRRIRAALNGPGRRPAEGAALSGMVARLRSQGIAHLQAWAAEGAIDTPADAFRLLEGTHLRSDFRVFFRNLLRELTLEGHGTSSHVSGEARSSRLKATFGEGVPPELFTRNWRGRAFHVTFQRQAGLVVWDSLPDAPGKPAGAVFLFWPLGHAFARTGIELALRHWRTISPSPRYIPSAIDLPAPGRRTRRRLLIPEILARTNGVPRALRALGRNLRIRPSRSSLGEIDLSALDRPHTTGGHRLFPLPLPPLSHLAGIICSPVPAVPPSITTRLARSGSLALLLLLLVFAARAACGRPPPSPGVRTELLLWLAAIASIPAALLIASQERLTADQSVNRRDELRATLQRHLERIDTGSEAITQRFVQACRAGVHDPSLPTALDRAVSDPTACERLFDRFEERCASAGMELIGIFAFGHGGFSLSRVSPAINPETAHQLRWYQEVLAIETLSRIAPDLARETPALRTRSSSAAEMGKLGILAKNDNFLGPPDAGYIYRLGNRHTLRYHDLIYHRGGARYIVFVLWSQDRIYRNYLAQSLARLQADFPGLGFGAYRPSPDGIRLEAAAATPEQLGELSMAVRNLPGSSTSNHEIVQLQGRAMPGLLLCAAAPLAPLERTLWDDLIRSLATFGCGLLLVFGAGLLLSRWLADPVRRMAAALKRVAADDLETRVALDRADELGDAGTTLDRMIEWLRERRAMSRFVSSQVLDVVSRGNLDDRDRPGRTSAALLVTDIRSFTTMSESHPPAEIFALLNRHLAVMTTIIQRHGGTIDRFIGDAIQAVFLPRDGDLPSRRALTAGAEMMEAHRRLQSERAERGAFTYSIGIGIDQGEVVTGILGDPQVRLDFTVLGEPLKHASDLEARSKAGRHTLVIASDQVRRSAGEAFRFEPLPDAEADPAWELVATAITPGPHPAPDRESAPTPSPSGKPATPAVPDLPATGTATGFSRSPGWAVVCLLLWLAPLFLLFASSRDLDRSTRLAVATTTGIQLRQDLQLAEQMSDPQSITHLLIQQHLTPVLSLDASVPSQRRRIEKRIVSLRRLLPDLHVVLTRSGREKFDLPAVTTFGTSRLLPPRDWGDVYQLFRSNLQGFSYPTRPGHDTKWMRNALSQTNLWGSLREGFGAFLKLPVRQRELLYTWFPLLGRDPSGPCPTGARAVEAAFRRTDVFGPRLSGALFMTCPPQAIDHAAGIDNIIRYLSRRGCALAVLPTDAVIPGRIHPAFTTHPGLGEALRQPGRPVPGWELLEGSVVYDRAFRLVAARRTVPPTIRLPSRLSFHWIALALWLLIGLFLLHAVRRAAAGFRLPGLHRQLTGAFVFVILPMLFLAILTLERTREEHRLRQFTANLTALRSHLDTTDRHREFVHAWAVGVADRLLHRTPFHQELIALERQRRPSSHETSSPLLKRESARLARWGLLCSNPMIVGTDNFFLGHLGARNLGSIKILTDLMRFAAARVLTSLAPATNLPGRRRAGDIGKDLIIGSGIEELQQLFIAATPADVLSRFLVAHTDLSNIALFNTADILLRIALRHEGNLRWVFEGNFKPVSLDAQALRSSGTGSTPLCFSDRVEPMFFSAPPYYAYAHEDGEIEGKGIADLVPPVLMNLTTIANRTALSPALRVGSGPDEQLVMTTSPARMTDKLLFTRHLTGREKAVSAAEWQHNRLLLLLVLLLSVLLARHIAARFLRPLTALSRASGAIMRQDYSVRLPVDRGGEFGDLAAAFNAMAQGVEEGRLLSRFVSESVRNAARDAGREEAARRGELTRAVVLFAGLGNFKRELAGTDPVLLIPRLNRYLETMSQAVRDHGGDIDKFIGEKILAVFFPDRLGGRTEASRAALLTALAMQDRLRQSDTGFGLPLGIGIVEGPVLAGIMGTPDVRLEYTVIGDTVNLASRLGDIAIRLDRTGVIRPTADGAFGGIVLEAGLQNLLAQADDPLSHRLTALDLPPIKGKTRSVQACRAS